MRKKNVIGYIRTAVEDPTNELMEKQEQKIRLFCEDNNLNLLKVFDDNGASGSNFERAGWTSLKKYLKEHNAVQHLIVAGHDRISRNVFSAQAEIDTLKIQYSVTVHSVNYPFAPSQDLKNDSSPLSQYLNNPKEIPGDDLPGRFVMVPKGLTADPADKRGEIGTIMDSDKRKDIVRVIFAGGTEGLYNHNALITLYPKESILHGLHITRGQLSNEQYAKILKVSTLMASGNQVAALRLAGSDAITERHCTMDCQSFLDIKKTINRAENRKRRSRRNRNNI